MLCMWGGEIGGEHESRPPPCPGHIRARFRPRPTGRHPRMGRLPTRTCSALRPSPSSSSSGSSAASESSSSDSSLRFFFRAACAWGVGGGGASSAGSGCCATGKGVRRTGCRVRKLRANPAGMENRARTDATFACMTHMQIVTHDGMAVAPLASALLPGASATLVARSAMAGRPQMSLAGLRATRAPLACVDEAAVVLATEVNVVAVAMSGRVLAGLWERGVGRGG